MYGKDGKDDIESLQLWLCIVWHSGRCKRSRCFRNCQQVCRQQASQQVCRQQACQQTLQKSTTTPKYQKSRLKQPQCRNSYLKHSERQETYTVDKYCEDGVSEDVVFDDFVPTSDGEESSAQLCNRLDPLQSGTEPIFCNISVPVNSIDNSTLILL